MISSTIRGMNAYLHQRSNENRLDRIESNTLSSLHNHTRNLFLHLDENNRKIQVHFDKSLGIEEEIKNWNRLHSLPDILRVSKDIMKRDEFNQEINSLYIYST